MAKVSIFVGSVYGNAQHTAEQAEEQLLAAGHEAKVFDDPSLDDFAEAEAVLVITSTTGQGDLPPNIEFFIMDLREQFQLMNGKPFAVVGLGDSSYGDSYAGAGRTVFELLSELQGKALADLLIIDAIETLEPETIVNPWVTETFAKA